MSSTIAHTPGPWLWHDHDTLRPADVDGCSSIHTILSPDGCFGYVGCSTSEITDEFEADLRLIAQAPNLLDALMLLATATAAVPSLSVAQRIALDRALQAIEAVTGVPS